MKERRQTEKSMCFFKEVCLVKKIQMKQLITILLFAVLITVSFDASKSMFTKIEIGQVSESNVLSPQTVTFTDEAETKKQRENVLATVQEVYELDSTVKETQHLKLKDFLTSVVEHKRLMEDDVEAKKTEAEADEEKTTTSTPISKDAYIAAIKNEYDFNKEELRVFFDTGTPDLNRMKEVFGKEVEKFYAAGITEEKLSELKKVFSDNTNFYFFEEKPRTLLLNKITNQLQPNMILNKEETDKKYTEASKSLAPVTKTIQRGEMVLRRGEVVNEKHLLVLKEVGYIQESLDIVEIAERFPFVFILLLALHAFLMYFNKKDIKNHRLYIFVFILTLVAVFLTKFLQNSYFTYGVLVLALIIITTFLNVHISILYAIILGLLLNVGDYPFLIQAILIGIVQVVGYNPKGNRNAYMNLGVIMSLVLAVSHVVISQILGNPIMQADFYPMLVAPVVASALAIGIFSYLESMLGLITSVKLHELSRPNHKLIERMINEAPGTFHHSLRVGQLAEAAADKIGANGLLLKVGAMFHDAGKLNNPKHFVENLIGKEHNPHEDLTPKESAAYILQHPIDSVKLCRKYGIPEQIIDLIEKHHGDDLVRYFYAKQKELDENADEKDFRYQTSLPITKEDGILMLADITEASSRAFINEEPEVVKEKLTDIIYKKIEEGQLRECELTMKEINIVIDTFIHFLLPSAHKRPKYPTENKKEN